MDPDAIAFLMTPEGERVLQTAELMEGSYLTRLSRLRKCYSPAIASTALELIELRERARKKFSLAHKMFFTREALEQSSSETISRYRAKRFPPESCVLDLGCGIGGDTIGLASRCIVTAVERDPIRLEMARRNVEVYGLSHRVKFVCADVVDIKLDAEAVFVDPSRRAGRKRVRNLSDVEPSVDFLHELTRQVTNTGIKLSPMFADEDLDSFGGEVEFISEKRECKEAVVWLGGFITTRRRATVLPDEASITSEGASVQVGMLSEFLYEPDPCVIRAHLVEELAQKIGAWKIDMHIAYLTSDHFVRTPLADTYRVVLHFPFSLKRVNSVLSSLQAGNVVVKKRGVAYDVRDIQRRLRTPGQEEYILVLTRISEKPWAIICNGALE